MITFDDVTKEMSSLQAAKNFDYGNSFEQTMNEFGLVASAIRLNDKVNRFKKLINPEHPIKVQTEKVEDTLMDLANYAVMTLAWMKNNENM